MIDDGKRPTWFIEVAKIQAYLLNPNHLDGASKDKFLRSFGYDPRRPEELANSLATQGMMALPGLTVIPRKGLPRLVLEGPLDAPDGRTPMVRTVWEWSDSTTLRFITLVPLTK